MKPSAIVKQIILEIQLVWQGVIFPILSRIAMSIRLIMSILLFTAESITEVLTNLNASAIIVETKLVVVTEQGTNADVDSRFTVNIVTLE